MVRWFAKYIHINVTVCAFLCVLIYDLVLRNRKCIPLCLFLAFIVSWGHKNLNGAKVLYRDEILFVTVFWMCIRYFVFFLSPSISWSVVFLNVDTTPVPHTCLLFIYLQGWICSLWIVSILFISDIHCTFTLKCLTYIDIIRRCFIKYKINKKCVVLTLLLSRHCCTRSNV